MIEIGVSWFHRGGFWQPVLIPASSSMLIRLSEVKAIIISDSRANMSRQSPFIGPIAYQLDDVAPTVLEVIAQVPEFVQQEVFAQQPGSIVRKISQGEGWAIAVHLDSRVQEGDEISVMYVYIDPDKRNEGASVDEQLLFPPIRKVVAQIAFEQQSPAQPTIPTGSSTPISPSEDYKRGWNDALNRVVALVNSERKNETR